MKDITSYILIKKSINNLNDYISKIKSGKKKLNVAKITHAIMKTN